MYGDDVGKLWKSVFFGLTGFDKKLNPVYTKFVKKMMVVERTGWTLEYINSLNDVEFVAVSETLDAIQTARNHLQRDAVDHPDKYDSGQDFEV